MKSKIKLGPVIRVGFGITFVLMAGLGVLSWTTIARLHETNDWVKHTYKVILNLKSLEKSMADMETGQRGFLVIFFNGLSHIAAQRSRIPSFSTVS